MRSRRELIRSPIHIDMTPMVDVMMLLLIFFMMSTTFLIVHPGFNIQPPQASAGTPQPPERITVQVNRDGKIAVGGQAVSLAELAKDVATKAHSQPLVFINADKEAQHGKVVEVIDAVKRAGAAKISIAVEPTG